MADTFSEILAVSETPPVPETPAPGNPATAGKQNEAGISASQQRKRPASTEALAVVPLLKRIRLADKADKYCWFCHEDGGPFLLCDLCPRSFHFKCVALPDMNNMMQWVCPECEKVMRAESGETRSKSMRLLQKDGFHLLLKYALERLQSAPQADAFREPVNGDQVPQYKEFIVYPCALSTIEQNIALKSYGCTEAFLADVKWIVHNCIIFNGTHHALTTSAKTLLKMCKHEVTEIEICPECYQNSCERQKDADWFCLPCKNPHPLVWAKLKGYPFWPAKALRELDGDVDVRFFGAHDRAWVPMSQVYYLSLECPAPAKGRKSGFDEAMRELRLHVKKLREVFGRYDYAPLKTPYKAMAVAGTASGSDTTTVRPAGQHRSQSSRKHMTDRKSEPSSHSKLAQSSAPTRIGMRTASTVDRATAASPRPSASAATCAASPRSTRTPRLASKHHLFIKHPLGGAGDADANGCGGDAGSVGEETSPDNGRSASSSSLSSTSQASLASQLAEGGPPNSSHVASSSVPTAAGQPQASDCSVSGSEAKVAKEDSADRGEMCNGTANRAAHALHVTAARPATNASSNGQGADARERSCTPEMPKLTVFTEERHSGLLAVCPSVVAGGNCPTLPGAPVSGAASLGSTGLNDALTCESGSSQHAAISASTNRLSPSDATASLTAITEKGCGKGENDSADKDKGLESGKDDKERQTTILEKGEDKDGKVDANIDRSAVQSLASGVISDTKEIPQNDLFFENLAQTIETCKAQLGLSDAQPCDDSEDEDDSQSSRSESSFDDNSGKHSGNGPLLGQTEAVKTDGSSNCATPETIACSVCSQPKFVDGDGSHATARGRNICHGCGDTKDATPRISVSTEKPTNVTALEPAKDSIVRTHAGASTDADSSGAVTSAAISTVATLNSCHNYNTVSKSLLGAETRSTAAPASSATPATLASTALNKLAIRAGSGVKPSYQPASSSACNIATVAAKNGSGVRTATQALRSKEMSLPLVSSMATGLPVRGCTPGKPVTGAISRQPVTGATSRQPVYGVTSRQPVTGATLRPPVTGATLRPPVTGATSGKPVTGAASGQLVTGATSGQPVTGATSGKPVTGATSGQPVTGATSGKPITGATSGKPVTGATSGKPVTGATARTIVPGTSSVAPQNGVVAKTATDEITRLSLLHQLELAEVKHSRDLYIYELKLAFEFEKHKALIKSRKSAEEQVKKAIEETKSKQWCSYCGQEANLYCCWNTSYCNYPCQELHWDQHMHVCGQITAEALEAALMSNGDGDDSGSNVAASNDSAAVVTEVMTVTPTISEPTASRCKPVSVTAIIPEQQAFASAMVSSDDIALWQAMSASLSEPVSVAEIVPHQQASVPAVSLLQQLQPYARHQSTSLNGDRSAEQKQAWSAGTAAKILTTDQHGRMVTLTVADRREDQQVDSVVTATSVPSAVPPPGTISTRRSAPTVLVVDENSGLATLRQQPATASSLTLATYDRNGTAFGAGTSRYQLSAATPVPVTVTVRSNRTGAVLGGEIPRQQPLPARLPTTADVYRTRDFSLLSGQSRRQQTSAAVNGGSNGAIPAPFFHSPASAQSGAGQSRSSGSGGPLGARRSAP